MGNGTYLKPLSPGARMHSQMAIGHRAQGCGWGRRRFTLAPLRCATGCLALLGLAARRGTRFALRATLKQPRQASQRAR